jgi:cytochrome c oxidase subunit 2
MKTVVGFAIALVFVIAVGAVAQERTAQERTVTERGWRIFVAQGCHGCHTIGKVGTPLGPDLTHIGRRSSEERLARWLADPEAVKPGAHMSALELTPSDIKALAAFLATLD